jgi:hypothetical protein
LIGSASHATTIARQYLQPLCKRASTPIPLPDPASFERWAGQSLRVAAPRYGGSLNRSSDCHGGEVMSQIFRSPERDPCQFSHGVRQSFRQPASIMQDEYPASAEPEGIVSRRRKPLLH